MNQILYILRQKDTKEIIFNYDTKAGNPKKAIFNNKAHADRVAEQLDAYVDTIQ